MTNIQAADLLKGLEQCLDDYCELNDEGKTAFHMAIAALELFGISEQLPSAQPEPCEDAVSRQRLLSDLKELTAAWGKYPVMAEQIKGVETAIGYVETIPSVTPERKKGKWNFIGDNMFECTYCGVAYTTQQLNGLRNYNVDPYAPKFCPNCGADMRGEQNERSDQQAGGD